MSSDAKASKCHFKFIFFLYLGSVNSLLMAINRLFSYKSLIKILILEENFRRHLEAFASEFFICIFMFERFNKAKIIPGNSLYISD